MSVLYVSLLNLATLPQAWLGPEPVSYRSQDEHHFNTDVLCFLFFILLCRSACGMLVPRSGIKLDPQQ